MNYGKGWRPDLPDARDYVYSDYFTLASALPSSVDLRPFCSPVENQGLLGSCTAQALVGALEFLENKHSDRFSNLSRLFVYYNERMIEGTTWSDSGAYLRDGIKTLATYGVCSESLWWYVPFFYWVKPFWYAYGDGKSHQIESYYRLNTLQEMKDCLANGYPFVFGFTVYESFESPEVSRTGIVPMPTPSERVLGGHAVLAVGYDDSTQRFLCRNSWGAGWGQAGYFTMPYAYLTDRNLSDDLWSIRTAENL